MVVFFYIIMVHIWIVWSFWCDSDQDFYEISPEGCAGLWEMGHDFLDIGFTGNTENSLYGPLILL